MGFAIPSRDTATYLDQARIYESDILTQVAAMARTGVVSGCAVTAQGTPDMTVAVAAGVVLVAAARGVVASGNVTIGAADGSNPRWDLVVASASGTKSVLAGTAAAQPKPAALDTTTYCLLAAVYVPAAQTTITTSLITDKRVTVPDLSGQGTATLNFGAFPGASDTSLAVTGLAGIVAGALVHAWIFPAATADHSADEHLVEQLQVSAGAVVAGTGFTLYGLVAAMATQVYGQWNVAYSWAN